MWKSTKQREHTNFTYTKKTNVSVRLPGNWYCFFDCFLTNQKCLLIKNLFLADSLALAFGANAAILAVTIEPVVITTITTQEKEFTKVEPSKVSDQVMKEINTKYEGYTISEAYQAEDGEYKLVLTKKDEKLTVHYKSNGEFVKERK